MRAGLPDSPYQLLRLTPPKVAFVSMPRIARRCEVVVQGRLCCTDVVVMISGHDTEQHCHVVFPCRGGFFDNDDDFCQALVDGGFIKVLQVCGTWTEQLALPDWTIISYPSWGFISLQGCAK